MLKIVFFAALREKLNSNGLTLTLNEEFNKIDNIKRELCKLHPEWQHALIDNSVLCAVNHSMVDDNYAVKSGDEIAFFPPVTGG